MMQRPVMPAVTEGSQPTLEGDDSPTVYRTEAGVWRYRTSGLGCCPRELAAYRLGYLPEEFSEAAQRRMREGKIHEPWIMAEIERQYGRPVGLRQLRATLPILEGLELSGSIDGAMIRSHQGQTLLTLVDGKAVGLAGFHRYHEEGIHHEPRYAWQFSGYWWALNHALAPARVEGAVLAVKNRNTGEVKPLEIATPPFSLEEVQGRIMSVELFARVQEASGSQPPELPACTGWHPFCRFPYLHETVARAEKIVMNHLAPLTDEYLRLRKLIEFANARMAEIKDDLAVAVPSSGTTCVEGAQEARVYWVHPKTARFSPRAFRTEHPDLYEKFRVSIPPAHLEIRGPKED